VKTPSRPSTLLVVVALGTLALLIAAARLHTYHEPLERDITSAAVIAREMLGGRSLYADMWDHKPPAIHVTHALAILLVGHGPGAVYLLNMAAAISTLLGVFVAASAVGGVAGGLWGAVFWTLVCGDVWLQANQPNAEVFINACIVWAFALLVRASGQPRVWRVLAIGGLFALASLYKPVAVATAALLALAHVAAPWPGCSRRRALADAFLIGGVGAAAWVATGAYFAARGHFGDFYQAVFTYNHFYSSHYWSDNNTVSSLSVMGNLLNSVTFDELSPKFLSLATTLAVLMVAGAVRGAISGPRRPWLLLLGLGIGTHLAVALPGQWRPHYYQLWLPLLAVGAGWTAAAPLAPGARRMLRWAPSAAASAAVVLLVAQQIPLYQIPSDAWSRLKYGEAFVAEQELGRELGALLAPGETFYEWGAETGLYFESRHSPPSGAFYVFPLVEGPAASPLTVRAVADLDRRSPAMFIVNLSFRARTRHPILDWAERHYVAMAGGINRGTYVLLVRRGSRLDVAPPR
jgi:hypothetical protein